MRRRSVETQHALGESGARPLAWNALGAHSFDLNSKAFFRQTNVRNCRDIDRGKTGDKTPGADPTAAPLETDAEASGMPLAPDRD